MSHSSGNEVELIDILRVVKRRWKFILTGVFLFTLLGVGISLLLPKKYQFSSVIQIGRSPGDGQSSQLAQLYESPETVIAKLRDVYIPLSRQKLATEGTEIPRVKIEHPKNSDLVQLVSKVKPDLQNVIEQLHGRVVDLLKQDHKHLKERFILALEADIARAKLRLQELQDPLEQSLREKRSQAAIFNEENLIERLQGERQIFDKQLEMLSLKKDRLQKRVIELQDALSLALKNRAEVAEKPGGESKAITLVMLDHQIDQDREQLAGIENALMFDLDEEKKELEQKVAIRLREEDRHKNRIDELKNSYLKEVSDNKRLQKTQKQSIEELQGRLSLNQETQLVALAVSSVTPVGIDAFVVIVISFFVGGFVVVSASFLIDYLRRFNQ